MPQYTGKEFADLKPEPSGPSAATKIGLFAFFVLTRAVHPIIIDASKVVDPITGKKSFPYGDMTVILGETVVTLVLAQLMALGIGGTEEWRTIWRPAPLKVFSFIGFVYALGDYFEMASMGSLGGAAYQNLLQSKLIITALMMWAIKGTRQTALQWNILFLVTLSMCVYMIGGQSDSRSSSKGGIPVMGVLNTLLKVTISCFCAVLSDRYMKVYKSEPIYVQLVQFKCSWFLTILTISLMDGKTWQNGFFTGWSGVTIGVLSSFTIKAWSQLYLLAILDSVLKNLGEAVAVLVIYAAHVVLPSFEDTFEVPAFLSVMVVVLSVTAYIGSKSVVEKAQKYDKSAKAAHCVPLKASTPAPAPREAKEAMAASFVPIKGDVAPEDWCGELLDLFSPDDRNPESRRFIDLIDGELSVSADTGGEKWGRRFDPNTPVNPTLAATDNPCQRKTNFASKVPKDAPVYHQVQEGALCFTLTMGRCGSKKVIKWNGLYDGKGGKFGESDAPPSDGDNFWQYVERCAEGQRRRTLLPRL